MENGHPASPYDDLKRLQQTFKEKLEALDPELPPLPEPQVGPDDEGWLFDSRRDYLEQLEHYNRHRK
jgi:hypothetical protein